MFRNGALTILALLILCQSLMVLGLEEDSQEGHCLQPPPKPDESLDLTWFNSIKTWYPLYGSKEGYYRVTQDVLHDNKQLQNVTTDEVVHKGCFKMNFYETTATVTGLGGHKEEFNIQRPSKGILIFKPIDKTGGTSGGYAEVTLTDNKSFRFTTECWDGDQEGFLVSSPYTSVDKATEDKIYAHAKSLGFDEKYFEKQDYSKCGFDTDAAPASDSEENNYYDAEDNLSDSNEVSDESGSI